MSQNFCDTRYIHIYGIPYNDVQLVSNPPIRENRFDYISTDCQRTIKRLLIRFIRVGLHLS